ncbi:hypothetical protein NPIL_25721 [Nephila pilipes]|uniref:Uncharacterized protein n=1 Tax=Nephila pilipes TaxID=299642 RepID=A0A8X6MRX0_NEPPI|nr:hypothetical protein NPIL_25721 [Nephila pilipes]
MWCLPAALNDAVYGAVPCIAACRYGQRLLCISAAVVYLQKSVSARFVCWLACSALTNEVADKRAVCQRAASVASTRGGLCSLAGARCALCSQLDSTPQ